MGWHPARARLPVLTGLAASSIFCVALLVVRPAVVGHAGQVYLAWNLFLAWIPLLVALAVYDRARAGRGGLGQLALVGAWLVFLPNAPYIVTDLIHLPRYGEPPLWFDTLTYLAFAWTGLMLGLVSLYLVHCAVRLRLGTVAGWATVAASTVLSGLGIYLGRFERWNSWDVVTNPVGLLADLGRIADDPGRAPAAVTALFAVFLVVTYLGLYAFAESPRQPR